MTRISSRFAMASLIGSALAITSLLIDASFSFNLEVIKSVTYGFALFTVLTFLNIVTFKNIFSTITEVDNSPRILVYILPGFKLTIAVMLLFVGLVMLNLSGIYVGVGALFSLIFCGLSGFAEYRRAQKIPSETN